MTSGKSELDPREKEIYFVFGSDASGGVYRAARNGDAWSIEPRSTEESLEGKFTLILPDEPAWRSWIATTNETFEYSVTDARVVTWEAGTPIISLLSPLDFESYEVFRSFPEGASPEGLHFVVQFKCTGVPGGIMTGVWVWRDGILCEQTDSVPEGLLKESLIIVTAPYTNLLRYLNGETTIYSVIPEGSSLNGNPSVIQYFAGYLELEAFKKASSPRQRRIRASLLEFLEHPRVLNSEASNTTEEKMAT